MFMLNNKGPLMFINTVNTEIEETKDQEIFDSSKAVKKKNINMANNQEEKNNDYIEDNLFKENVKPKFIEERKIKNIIEMYHKDRPVLCNIITNDIEIIGIPYMLDDSLLYVKTSEDQCKNIKLDAITDIIIIKF